MINLKDKEECKKLINLIINEHGTNIFVTNEEIFSAVEEDIKDRTEMEKTERYMNSCMDRGKW